MIAFLLISFAVLLLLGVPIVASLGLSSALGILFVNNGNLVTAAQRIFEGMNSFPLLAIPLYTFAGAVMSRGGIAKRLIDFCYSLVGHVTGGLAHVNVLSSMVFAGMSGSAAADTAGLSGMIMKQMVKKGYSKDFSVAVTAISSTIGIIIPPSIPMVVISGILGVSAGKMFLGGILPGILLGVAQMIVCYFIAKKEKVPKEAGKFSIRSVGKNFISSFWALMMPVVILGTIMSGFVSPTEAGAIAVVYGLVVSSLCYHELNWADIWAALLDTAKTSAKIFVLIGSAALFTKLLTVAGFHVWIQNILLSVSVNPTVILLLSLLIILVVTCFMDTNATLTMLIPVLFPVIQAVGVDPIVFCVLVVICCAVGLVTPPVGLCLYVACDLMDLGIGRASKAVLPFVGVTLLCILIIIAFPQMITSLAGLL